MSKAIDIIRDIRERDKAFNVWLDGCPDNEELSYADTKRAFNACWKYHVQLREENKILKDFMNKVKEIRDE